MESRVQTASVDPMEAIINQNLTQLHISPVLKAHHLVTLLEERYRKKLDLGYCPSSLLNYFKETEGDGIRVTWARNTNTMEELAEALRSNSCILEGDVDVSPHEPGSEVVPIMNKAGQARINLSLERWLLEVDKGGSKGIKVNFQSRQVVEPAVQIIAESQVKGPVILSADVLAFTEHSSKNVEYFFKVCKDLLPRAILCIGWTSDIYNLDEYPEVLLVGVAELIEKHCIGTPVMIAVNPKLLKNCIPEVQRLLFRIPHSSLFVWTDETYPLCDLNDLVIIRELFSIEKVFYRIPRTQLRALMNVEDS